MLKIISSSICFACLSADFTEEKSLSFSSIGSVVRLAILIDLPTLTAENNDPSSSEIVNSEESPSVNLLKALIGHLTD
jgi:hypothetical protein